MNKTKLFTLIFLGIILLIIVVFVLNGIFKNSVVFMCQKSNNCCSIDSDCKYIWYTGSCNTPEYVDKIQHQSGGPSNSEAPWSPAPVNCSCENNKCITNYYYSNTS